MTETIHDLGAPVRRELAAICTLMPNDSRVIAACHALLDATDWLAFESASCDSVKRGMSSPAEALDTLCLLLERKWEPTLRREVVGRYRARAVPRFEFADQFTNSYDLRAYGSMATAGVLLFALDTFQRKYGPDAAWGETWAGMLHDAIERIFVAYRGTVDPYLAARGLDPKQVILKPVLAGTPARMFNGRLCFGDQWLVIEVFPNEPEYVALADHTEALFAQAAMNPTEAKLTRVWAQIAAHPSRH